MNNKENTASKPDLHALRLQQRLREAYQVLLALEEQTRDRLQRHQIERLRERMHTDYWLH